MSINLTPIRIDKYWSKFWTKIFMDIVITGVFAYIQIALNNYWHLSDDQNIYLN